MAVDTTYSTTLVACTCWCGIPVGVPQNLYRQAKEQGTAIGCLSGKHNFVYGETEVKKLRRKLDNEEATTRRLMAQRDAATASAEHERHVAQGYKGALVATKKRIAKGVCPCCKRSFVDVTRHMSTQHPDYGS